jgi:hypothetical protein
MSDSNPPDAFGTLDTLFASFNDPMTDEERRLTLRCIARNLEVMAGQLHVRLGDLVDALTPKVGR